MPEAAVFEERQRMSQGVTVGGLALTLVALCVAAAAADREGRLAQAAPVLIMTGVAVTAIFAFVATTSLVTRVTTAEAVVQFRPFKTLRLSPDQIASVSTKTFGLFDGGIGYHIGLRSLALTAATGTGVLVTRPDGYRILIGTQRPDALVSALLRLKGSAPAAEVRG